jgi:hypothetical protein
VLTIRKKFVLLLLFFLLFTAGCQKTGAVVDVITFQPADYDIMLFTDQSCKSLKNIYMDALLELKAAHPNEFRGGGLEEEKSINELNYKVSPNGPTLLILKDGKTLSRLTGEKTKSEIIDELQSTIH